MSLIEEVCGAMVAEAKRDLAAAKIADAERPIGTKRIEIDAYDDAERKKPIDDYDFHLAGRHYQGSGTRWCVVIERWNGKEWRRQRRISGPLKFVDALTRRTEERARRNATGASNG